MRGYRFVLAVAAACIALPHLAQARDLRLGIITPPSHQWSKSAEAFAKDLDAASGGRLKVLVFPSGQLGTEAQMLQQMQSGALDFAFLAAGEVANRRSDFAALFAPYLVKTPSGAQRLLNGPTATGMLTELRSVGLVGLGYGMAGLRQVLMRGKVATRDDLAGRKIRTMPIEPERDFWRKAGAAPTPIPLPSLFDAFANGQVDGMQIDFENAWNVRYIDNAGTVIESNHMMLPMVAVASARNWQSLSADDQALVRKLVVQRLDEMFQVYETLDADYLKKIRASGANVIKVDRTFFGPSIDAWYEEWRAKAPSLPALEREAASL